jgi:steroid delta-isomerase-like uncharacterized protein/uncharacterized protein (TIGR02246 family)
MEVSKQPQTQRRKVEDVQVALNVAAIRSLVDDVYSKGDLQALDRLLADEVRLIDSSQPAPAEGKAGYRANVEMVRGLMPDLRCRIVDLVAQADRVAVHWVVSGTHTGRGMGIEPTGRAVRDVAGASVFRLINGKIAEERVTWDTGNLFEQLGVGLGNEPITKDLIAAEKKALEARLKGFSDAFSRHDAKAVASYFAEDGTLLTPSGVFASGRSEIEKAVQSDLTNLIQDATSELKLERMHLLSPKLCAVDLSHTMRGPNLPGGTQAFHVSGVGKKVNGEWLWLHGRPYAFAQPPKA